MSVETPLAPALTHQDPWAHSFICCDQDHSASASSPSPRATAKHPSHFVETGGDLRPVVGNAGARSCSCGPAAHNHGPIGVGSKRHSRSGQLTSSASVSASATPAMTSASRSVPHHSPTQTPQTPSVTPLCDSHSRGEESSKSSSTDLSGLSLDEPMICSDPQCALPSTLECRDPACEEDSKSCSDPECDGDERPCSKAGCTDEAAMCVDPHCEMGGEPECTDPHCIDDEKVTECCNEATGRVDVGECQDCNLADLEKWACSKEGTKAIQEYVRSMTDHHVTKIHRYKTLTCCFFTAGMLYPNRLHFAHLFALIYRPSTAVPTHTYRCQCAPSPPLDLALEQREHHSRNSCSADLSQ